MTCGWQGRLGLSRRTLGAGLALSAAAALTSCSLFERVVADDEAGPREATVVVLAPDGTASGKSVLAAVELAIDKSAGDIGGWTIDVDFVDDAGHDDGPAELAREMVGDDVIAVIGGLSTDVVRAVQPVLSSGSVLFVSPADTVPEHTRGADPGNPLRPYSNYYRTSAIGEDPMQALARYAVGSLEASRVAVIDAGESDEAAVFAEAVDDAGGDLVRIAGHDDEESPDLEDEADDEGGEDTNTDSGAGDGDENAGEADENSDDGDENEAGDENGDDGDENGDDGEAGDGESSRTPDAAAMVASARAENAEAVFVAGSADLAAAVADELARTGGDIELLGGSVMLSDDFLAEAGSAAEGAWTATHGELGTEANAVAEQAESDLSGAGLDVTDPNVAGAYDAGMAVGTVLTACLPPASSATAARRGCIGELAEVAVAGATAEVAFDEYGDRAGSIPVFMVVRGGQWTTLEPGS
ncbi:ABC transporter substrate-binding protein [Phytoactinopolyspora mesophila]|uniref:ABC transporter substrate-binding protein n=1 Tax=Phytoactinopolyspora mesophila TaxID=2650750 RepID=A0A7K3LWV6_9ACTN|nr:ABC transporter substrate-binding protein [Phytoactinopolyspora mesophila]NDL55483.1 ABC transporter substrate-binding protein [Phytoactinopolyspora mesophila]